MAVADNLGAFLGGAAGGAIQNLGLPVLGQVSQVLSQGANRFIPTQLPSFGQICALYYQDFLGWDEALDWLRSLGVGANVTGEGAADRANLWKNVIRTGRPLFPVDVLFRAWCLNDSNRDQLRYEFQRHGFPLDTEWQLLTNDSNALPLPLILQLLLRDLIKPDQADRYLRHAGFGDQQIRALLQKESTPLDLGTALSLLNRGVITSDDVTLYQKWAGVRDQDVQDRQKQMRFQWPVLSGVINYARTGAMDPSIVGKLDLLGEKPSAYDDFAKTIGANWGAGQEGPRNYPLGSVTVSDLEWAAHWRPLDMATATEMLHRLRPTGGPNGGPRFPGVAPFTMADYDQALRLNAVPPGLRDQFKAISNTIPPRTYMKSLYTTGLIGKQDAIERAKDQGYDDTTAALLVDGWDHAAQQKKYDKLRPITTAQIKQAYQTGTMPRNAAAVNLYIVYLDDYAQVFDFLSKNGDEQIMIALASPWVTMALASIDADVTAEIVKQGIEVQKQAFLRYELSAPQALSNLVNMGVTPERSRQYVTIWSLEAAAKAPELHASQLIGYYVDGLLDKGTLTARLSGLGYGPGDVSLLLGGADLKVSQRLARQQAAAQKTQAMQARLLMAQQKALEKQQAANQAQICKSASKNQMAKWAAKGFVSYADAFKRITQCGVLADDAIDLMAAAQPAKGGLSVQQIQAQVGSVYQTTKAARNGSAPGPASGSAAK